MGRLIVFFGLLASLCASCVPCYRDTALYQRSGKQKAIVAVLPVINHGEGADLSWDLSTEFTDEMRRHVYDSSKLYLLRDLGSREIAQRLNTPNPEMIPLVQAKDLGAAEFVVVSELIDQKLEPMSLRENHSQNGNEESVLRLSMRVRVLDVRHDKPKVILQEVVHNEHILDRAYMANDYQKTPWGTEAFQYTPLGFAHHKLVREIVSRVENYIEAAR